MINFVLMSLLQGIDAADVVVICVTEDYKKSGNNQKEAEYANKQKKLILPLKMEDSSQTSNTDWVGFVIGNRRYVDFSDDSKLDRVMMAIDQAVQESRQ